MKKYSIFILVTIFVLSGLMLSGCTKNDVQTGGSDKNPDDSGKETGVSDATKLVIGTQWVRDYQRNGIYENETLKEKGLQNYLDEYAMLNDNMDFELAIFEYAEYESKLNLLYQSDVPLDIFAVYSSWGVAMQEKNMLDKPPKDIVDDVKASYMSYAGVTIDGEIWGIPTEINDYALIYNKELLKEAGIVDANGNAKPPVTWDEFVDTAVKTTKKDADGNIVQYGFAITKDMDWAVVDPYLSLLFTNNGKFISDDNKKCLVNSPEGVEALNAYLELYKKGASDINSNVFDFGKGTVAMIIVAPWHEGTISQGLGDKFDDVVGVSPMPYLKTPASLQYSWFIAVSSKSQHKEEAWAFLKWFTSDIQPATGTTRYGDLLARNIGAIPSRKVDIEGNADKTKSFFKKTFVDELPNSVAEPNIAGNSEAKRILMEEIKSAIINEKTAEAALNDACLRIDVVLNK